MPTQLTTAAHDMLINSGMNAAGIASLTTAAQNSAYFAGMLNDAAQQGKSIVLADVGAGTSTSGNGKVISVDRSWIPGAPGGGEPPNIFATSIAHELGHALLPGGSATAPANAPDRAATIGGNAEGVALVAEFIVAKQLGLGAAQNGYMHSDQGQQGQPVAGTLTSQLDQAAMQTSLNVSQVTYGSSAASTFGAVGSPAVNVAATFNLDSQHPSIAPNLTYREFYSDWNIIGSCSSTENGDRIKPDTVDWLNMVSTNLQYTKNADGSCTFNGTNIHLLPSSPAGGGANGGTATVSGTVSNPGSISILTSVDVNMDGSADTVDIYSVNADGSTVDDFKALTVSGQVQYEQLTTVSADHKTTIVRTDANGDSTFEKSVVAVDTNDDGHADVITTNILVYDGITDVATDTNADGLLDNRELISATGTNPLETLQDIQSAEHLLTHLYDLGQLGTAYYQDFTQWSSDALVFGGSTLWTLGPDFNLSLDPIGAFYESRTPATDLAPGIANKTPVVLDAANQGLTAAALTSLDANADGKLSGNELTPLKLWSDLNENGVLDPNELQTVAQAAIGEIGAADYGFYTAGNSHYVDAASAPPPNAVPASNYRTLRDTDNTFWFVVDGGNGWINWSSSQIKINYGNPSYLIGTDGNDGPFDVAYYAAYPQYFNVNLLTNFLGGGGDDIFGGSVRNDRLWGGVGNDWMAGYAGDDGMYGEEGDDTLQGQDGQDSLDGGVGVDILFGGAGDDALSGGDGDDILMGFTAGDDPKQSLAIGESDNDTLHGGAGNDTLQAGAGDDSLWGGEGLDELNGGEGQDRLYGDNGNDGLFGQVGDDILYGGEGNDILVGFTGTNEAKQTLDPGETDNDHLYGGAGKDTLLGGLGNDYLDGGAGADKMEGGAGDDLYIVNSVNDVILEQPGAGHDTVTSSVNYLLNANIEDLRLLAGLDINGSGNALANRIVGNERDNILDGITGADTMIGGAGDDTYYVDNSGDQTIELANEGTDTVQTTITTTLATDLENLILLDFTKPEHGLVDGQPILVYGYPKANELDYMQGDAVPNFTGTCALTSIANLLTQAGTPTTEGQVVQRALENGWTVGDLSLPNYVLGGSNFTEQQQLLDSYGTRNDLLPGYNEDALANLLRSGRGVILAVNAGALWNDASYGSADGSVNHVVTVTGVAVGEVSGEIAGFYIADSGRGKVSDMTRFVGIDEFRLAANVAGAYAIYTVEPLKMWDENIDGVGNALDNSIVGNRAENFLDGGSGADTLTGGAGNDSLVGGFGLDTAVYAGARSGYSVTKAGAGYTVIDSVGGRDGGDTLGGIERLQFSDTTMKLGMTANDYNGDGKSDLLVRNTDGTTLMWLIDGSQTLSNTLMLGAGSWSAINGHGDYNGDGKSDLVVQDSNGDTRMWLMNGGQISSSGILFGPGNWRVIDGQGDYDGDGKSDLLVRNSDGETRLWLMNGSQVGSSSTLLGAGNWSVVEGHSDYNGDGNSDLVVRNANGETRQWLMNGGQVSSSTTLLGGGDWSVIAGQGDYNGDGKSDLVVQQSNGETRMWLMNGGQISTSTILLGAGSWRVIDGQGDYDGDGKSDLLIQNSNREARMWLMNGTQVSNSTTMLGPGSWGIADGHGDYNGDGKSDLVVQNSSGDTRLWLMNGIQTTSSTTLLGAGNWNTWQTEQGGVVTGDGGANILVGTTGNDRLYGNAGNDMMSGGGGNDQFVFNTALDAGTNVDTITDFSRGADQVLLDHLIFTVPGVGNLAAGSFVAEASAVAHDGNDYILYDTTTGNLSYDPDGSGTAAAALFANFATHPAISAGDFLIV